MESTIQDKASWPPGPWHAEPDRLEFEHKGVPCLLVRNKSLGNWCGYAAVPPGHPLHGKGYDAPQLEDVRAHGGLTYASACCGEICHTPKAGEPDDVWWFGFDCAHAFDLAPYMVRTRLGRLVSDDQQWEYRDINYVKFATIALAEQLLERA